jgi:hypothetical protein
MGIPASAKAKDAAVAPTVLVPPSDCKTSIKISIDVLGNNQL